MMLWLLRVVASCCGFEHTVEFEASNALTNDRPKVAMFFASNRACYDAAVDKAMKSRKAEGK